MAIFGHCSRLLCTIGIYDKLMWKVVMCAISDYLVRVLMGYEIMIMRCWLIKVIQKLIQRHILTPMALVDVCQFMRCWFWTLLYRCWFEMLMLRCQFRRWKLITMEFVENFQWRIVASYEMLMAKLDIQRYFQKYLTNFVRLLLLMLTERLTL